MNNLTMNLVDLVEHAALDREVAIRVRIEGIEASSLIDGGRMMKAQEAAQRLVDITATLARVNMVPHFTLIYNY